MKFEESVNINVSGNIAYSIANDTETLVEVSKPNVITYTAADIMARLVGGDTRYTPQHIGFLYGTDPDASLLLDPELLPSNMRRRHTWEGIASDTAGANGNILISPLVLNPKFSTDDITDTYKANSVTFAAFSGTFMDYAFPTSGSTFAGKLDTLPVIYFYQAILLNRRQAGSTAVYDPFARVSLRDPATGEYNVKPEGFDFSLFWTITFN